MSRVWLLPICCRSFDKCYHVIISAKLWHDMEKLTRCNRDSMMTLAGLKYGHSEQSSDKENYRRDGQSGLMVHKDNVARNEFAYPQPTSQVELWSTNTVCPMETLLTISAVERVSLDIQSCHNSFFPSPSHATDVLDKNIASANFFPLTLVDDMFVKSNCSSAPRSCISTIKVKKHPQTKQSLVQKITQGECDKRRKISGAHGAIPIDELRKTLSQVQTRCLRPVCIKLTSGVVSSGCVIALKRILESYRSQSGDLLWSAAQSLSNDQRMNAIAQMDNQQLYCCLIKRLLSLQIYMSCRESSGLVEQSIVLSPANQLNPYDGPGNPIHSAKAGTTRMMLKCIYPELEPNDESYQKRYAEVSIVQNISVRLFILLEAFDGNIGTLAFTLAVSGKTFTQKLASDNDLIRCPIPLWNRMVYIWKQRHQDIIFRFANAAKPILEHIFNADVPAGAI